MINEEPLDERIDKAIKEMVALNKCYVKRKTYEKYLVNLNREKDIIDTAREDGKKEIVNNMLKEGLSIEEVSKYTGLSAEEIKDLKQSLNDL